jgi:hypothetical protein
MNLPMCSLELQRLQMGLSPHPQASNMAAWFGIPTNAVPEVDNNCACEWCMGTGGLALYWSYDPRLGSQHTGQNKNRMIGRVYFHDASFGYWEGNWGCQVSQGFGPYGNNTPQTAPGTLWGIKRNTDPVTPVGAGPYRGGPPTKDTTKAIPVAAIGHNCRKCNQRNDYASANQPDGTYICFNCRT